jgi:hypothetical protein
MERLHGTTRWENQPVPDNVTVAALDTDEIRKLAPPPLP